MRKKLLLLITALALMLSGMLLSTTAATAGGIPTSTINVLSYNVRNPHAVDIWPERSWDTRHPWVTQLINDDNPDVFGVQEASSTNGEVVADDLVADFDEEYDYYRPDGGSPKMIFWRADRFTPVTTGGGSFNQLYAPEDPNYNADCDQYRTYAWALLNDSASGRDIFVMNVHLRSKIYDCWEWRDADAHQIHQTIVANNPGNDAVILFGDFNNLSEDCAEGDNAANVGKPITTISEMHTDEHPYNLDTYGTYHACDPTFNIHWNHDRSDDNTHRIDWIWYSKKLVPTDYHVWDRLFAEMSDGSLNSPSDHYAISTTLGWTE